MPSPGFRIIAALLIFIFTGKANALNDDGHRVVGVLAMEQTDDKATAELESILGSVSRERIGKACTWPDLVRPTPEWEHTYPWHYVNQPRWSDVYDRSRDCKNDDCLIERIKWAAARLGDEQLDSEQREQAFNFFCHFMGDLHQPMHNGYGDDRGGNEVEVVVHGTLTDLHTFWDHHLIETYHPSWEKYADELEDQMPTALSGPWSPDLINTWSDESRAHVKNRMYPDTKEISCTFEQEARIFLGQQLRLAGNRMAWILNSVLGEGMVDLSADYDSRK